MLNIRLSAFDVILACVAPILALYLRDYLIFSSDMAITIARYWLVTMFFSLIALLIFRIRDGMARYFSVDDVLDVGKAVMSAEFMTCVVLFTFNRFDGIPRSTPLIHALVLLVGLITARTLVRMIEIDPIEKGQKRQPLETEHIIIIGSNPLSALYIKLLDAYAAGDRRVIAVLDNRPRMIGRAISGIPIVGPPQHLKAIVAEYVVHGFHTDRVIVGGEESLLPTAELEEIRRVCEQSKIKLEFLPQLIGLNGLKTTPIQLAVERKDALKPPLVSPYLRRKRYVDFVVALILLLFLFPFFAIASLLALLDVGPPVLFWQQRLGLHGRTFLLYKFRTLQPPFDSYGLPVPQERRLSRIGVWLRESRLDELPQLLNVLVGDMSLIGPRPLLPEDQPLNPAGRLMVRPGITGWAQVNGAKLLSPSEKQELDEWYVRNASLWLDMRIILMTLQITSGARQSDEAATDKVRMSRPDLADDQKFDVRPTPNM